MRILRSQSSDLRKRTKLLDRKNILTTKRKKLKEKKSTEMSWIKKIINRLFLNSNIEVPEKDLKPQLLDNIWVYENNKLYSGCIWDISRRKITITFYKDGEGFIDETLLKSDIKDNCITKNNITVYFRKPCFTD